MREGEELRGEGGGGRRGREEVGKGFQFSQEEPYDNILGEFQHWLGWLDAIRR